VDRATRLVEQLMTLARLDPQYDAHAANHALEPMDLSALLAARLPTLREQAEKQQLHLEATLEHAPCLVHAASFLILLRNLIDNALRYTPVGGRVHLSCQIRQQQVCLTIADSGPGIPVAMRTRVFDRFFRLSDAGKSGSGLGLSIVKRIAEAHHATIELADGLDGAGLAVQICFPLCRADQEQLA
jgi:signal transduction histidine kinase